MLKIRPLKAGIAQLVEHNLAKVGVASSSLVSRSRIPNPAWPQSITGFFIVRINRLATRNKTSCFNAWHCAAANSRIARFRVSARILFPEARWQSGYAAACKAVYAGSIPTLASNFPPTQSLRCGYLVSSNGQERNMKKNGRVVCRYGGVGTSVLCIRIEQWKGTCIDISTSLIQN